MDEAPTPAAQETQVEDDADSLGLGILDEVEGVAMTHVSNRA